MSTAGKTHSRKLHPRVRLAQWILGKLDPVLAVLLVVTAVSAHVSMDLFWLAAAVTSIVMGLHIIVNVTLNIEPKRSTR
jgi:hypothetical protein